MLEQLRRLADEGASFAFETTLATRSYARWLRSIIKRGYALHIVFLWLHSPELAIDRIASRVSIGGHHIEDKVVRRRYLAGIRNFFDLYSELAKTWVVYDNSKVGQPQLIASGSRNELELLVLPEAWRSFCEVAQ